MHANKVVGSKVEERLPPSLTMSMKEPVILVVFCLWALAGCGKKKIGVGLARPRPLPDQAVQLKSNTICRKTRLDPLHGLP